MSSILNLATYLLPKQEYLCSIKDAEQTEGLKELVPEIKRDISNLKYSPLCAFGALLTVISMAGCFAGTVFSGGIVSEGVFGVIALSNGGLQLGGLLLLVTLATGTVSFAHSALRAKKELDEGQISKDRVREKIDTKRWEINRKKEAHTLLKQEIEKKQQRLDKKQKVLADSKRLFLQLQTALQFSNELQ